MTRQEANRRILELVGKAIEEFPDWRFHQILQNIGVERPNNDQWHEESEATLRNMAMPTKTKKSVER